jgi:aspartate 1-decarboxylase
MRILLRSKIHKARITETDIEYVGSITIDADLIRMADIWPGEKVLVADMENGARFETYVLEGEPGSGIIGVNGAAARLVKKGDAVIIMAFEITDLPIRPKILLVDEQNKFSRYL